MIEILNFHIWRWIAMISLGSLMTYWELKSLWINFLENKNQKKGEKKFRNRFYQGWAIFTRRPKGAISDSNYKKQAPLQSGLEHQLFFILSGWSQVWMPVRALYFAFEIGMANFFFTYGTQGYNFVDLVRDDLDVG